MICNVEASDIGSPEPLFIVGPIEPNQARTVYPLLQSADPSLSLAQRLQYTRRIATRRFRASEGILVARRPGAQRHPCGVVCYRREHSLSCGLVLTAEHLIALDLLGSDTIQLLLLNAFDDVAVRFGCAATRLIVPVIRPGMLDRLLDKLGRNEHLTEGSILTRTIPRAATGRQA